MTRRKTAAVVLASSASLTILLWCVLQSPLRPLLTGTARGCSIAEVRLATKHLAEQQALVARLKADSRPLASSAGDLKLWDTPLGQYYVPLDTDLFFVLAEQERDLYGSSGEGVVANDVVLDCGANVGVFVREALNRGASKVIAIEPVPRNIDALQRTFSSEIDAGRVVVVPAGVWNKPDILRMYTYRNSALDSFILSRRPESASLPVAIDLPLTTIDAIVAQLGLQRVDFIKIDVEGAERQALEGARHTLSRFRPRMAVATENLPDDFAAIPATVASFQLKYEYSFAGCTLLPEGIIRPEIAFFKPELADGK